MSQTNHTTSNHQRPNTPTANAPEVVERAKRRQFSAAEKLRILQAADACSEPGQIGALLRREGIYSSYLADWRCENSMSEKPQTGKAGEPRQLRQELAAKVKAVCLKLSNRIAT